MVNELTLRIKSGLSLDQVDELADAAKRIATITGVNPEIVIDFCANQVLEMSSIIAETNTHKWENVELRTAQDVADQLRATLLKMKHIPDTFPERLEAQSVLIDWIATQIEEKIVK